MIQTLLINLQLSDQCVYQIIIEKLRNLKTPRTLSIMQNIHSSFISPVKFHQFKVRLSRFLSQPKIINGSIQPQQGQEYKSQYSDIYPLQRSKLDLLARVLIYVMESISIISMIVICVCSFDPILYYDQYSENSVKNIMFSQVVTFILIGRIALALGYIFINKIRNNYFYLLHKMFQILSLILFRATFTTYNFYLLLITLVFQYSEDLVYVLCKQQRYGYFDSRLTFSPYIIRLGISQSTVFFFNLMFYWKTYSISLLLLLFACSFLHCVFIFHDTIYSRITLNFLFFLWLIALWNTFYFISVYSCGFDPGNKLFNIFIPLFLSISMLLFAWRNRDWIGTRSITNFDLLLQNFGQLTNKNNQILYLWQAIRLISLGPNQFKSIRDVIMKISWVLKKSKQNAIIESIKNAKGQLGCKNNSYTDFYIKFVQYCYIIMVQNFKRSPEIKYMLIFFFNSKCAERVLLYLNNSDFYDIRQGQRIKGEHRVTDVAAKINEMKQNQIQVYRIVDKYSAKLSELSESLLQSTKGIDLQQCEQVGMQLIDLQKAILKFGYHQPHLNSNKLINRQKYIFGYQNHQNFAFTIFTQNLLNAVRKQLLEVSFIDSKHNRDNLTQYDIAISEIIDQEDPLFLISAQPNSIGQIVAVNASTCKLTYYLESELIGKDINIIIPEAVRMAHSKIMIQRAGYGYKNESKDYVMKNTIYVQKKNKYCSRCAVQIRFINGTMGRRWLVRLKQIEKLTPFIICDEQSNIIGFNEAIHKVGLGFDWLDVHLGQSFLNKFKDIDLLDPQQAKKEYLMNIQDIKNGSNYEELINNEQLYYDELERNRSRTMVEQSGVKSLKLVENPKVYHQRRSMNKRKAENILVQCRLINSNKKVGQIQILGYYIISIELAAENYIKSMKTNQKENQKQNIMKRVNSNQSLLKGRQFSPKGDKKREKHGKRYSQKKSKKRNNLLKSSQSNSYNIEFSSQNQTTFQFIYLSTLNKLVNISDDVSFLQMQDILAQSNVITDSLPLYSQFREEKNCFNPDFPDRVAFDYQDINELIYIKGQLQFRENKRLEEKHNCQSHPVHTRNQLTCGLSEQALRQKKIGSKEEIFEVIESEKTEEKSLLSGRNIKGKILIGLIFTFIFLSFGLAIGTAFSCNQILSLKGNKVRIGLLMIERAQRYNNLATILHQIFFQNLEYQVFNSISELTIRQLVGESENWTNIIKEIQQKNSQIEVIDSVQQGWKSSRFVGQTQVKLSTEFSSIPQILLLDLLELQKSIQNQSNYIHFYNITDQLIWIKRLFSISKDLMEEYIPINIYIVFKGIKHYEDQVQAIKKVSTICIILYSVFTLLLGITFAILVHHINNQHQSNMKIFTFFTPEYLEQLSEKLQNFRSLLKGDADITSSLGFDQFENQMTAGETLLMHKKKIKRKSIRINFLILFGLLFFVGFATSLGVVSFFVVEDASKYGILQSIFNYVNVFLTEINYSWHQSMIKANIQRSEWVSSLFSKLTLISKKSIYLNTNYAKQFKSILMDVALSKKEAQFSIQPQYHDLFQNTSLCQFIEDGQKAIVCENQIEGFSFESIQYYIKLKQLISNTLFIQSIEEKSLEKFRGISKLFDSETGKLNDENIILKSKVVLNNLFEKISLKTRSRMYVGLSIIVAGITGAALVLNWHLKKQVSLVNQPILIMTKCFPLVGLNQNIRFLDWYHTKKKEVLR